MSSYQIAIEHFLVPSRSCVLRILLFFMIIVSSACGRTHEPAAEGFIEVNGAQLRYRLDLPVGHGPFPAVVIAHGAGMVTREAHTNDTRQFLKMGFGVLRFDKRGVGESTGQFQFCCTDGGEERVALLAADLMTAAVWLALRPEIDSTRVGYHGISQGGWIVAEALADSGVATFASINSGSVLSTGLNLYYEQLTQSGKSADEAQQMLSNYVGPAYYNPVPAIRHGRKPIFYGLGKKDRLTPSEANMEVLSALVADGLPITYQIYPGGRHGLDGTHYFQDVENWLGRIAIISPVAVDGHDTIQASDTGHFR